jgi:SlyX protein
LMAEAKIPAELMARMAELEARYALCEDQLDALNLTVYRQQQHIDRLERELRALRDQVEAMGAASNAPKDELPPHY